MSEGTELATAGERAERDRRIVSLYTEPINVLGHTRSIREVATIVGISHARVREVLAAEGVLRHRGEPGTRPGPQRDPNAVARRKAIPYRPDAVTRENIEKRAGQLGVSMQELVDRAVKAYFNW